MNDEELISAYVDGRMSEPERAAFEARLQADAALRRQLAVTRLLVVQSRQVESVPAPKNFILPHDFGKATQPATSSKRIDWRLLFFRFGSVAAAMVFVFAVAFDALRSTPAATPAAAPMAAQAEVTLAPEAAIATNIEPVTATMAPEQAPAAGAAAMPAGTPMMQSRAMPAEAMTTMEMTSTITPPDGAADAMTASLPSAASAKSAPVPMQQTQAYEAPAAPAPPEPLITPARIIAALALLFAITLGIAGWRR
jgi:hypothetical protein